MLGNLLSHYPSEFARLGIEKILTNYGLVHESELKYPNSLNQDTGQIDKYNIEVLSKFQESLGPLLLMLDSNPFSSHCHNYLIKLAEQNGIELKIFSANALDYFTQDCNFVYYPCWLFRQQTELNYQVDQPKKFRFSFLSNQARFHRLYLYQQCRSAITHQDCFAINVNNFTQQQSFIHNDAVKHLGHNINLLDHAPFYLNVDNDEYQDKLRYDSTVVDYSNNHNAYSAFINITGESNTETDIVFFSEKTWKPIRSRCLFMTLGNPGAVSVLKKFGFAIPDIELDLPILEKISYISNQMALWDYDKCCSIYRDNYDCAEYNQSWFADRKLAEKFVNQIKDKLKL